MYLAINPARGCTERHIIITGSFSCFLCLASSWNTWPQVYTKESGKNEFRHFLDNQQYQTNGILRYERIFGQGYVSTGGFETTKVCILQP